MTPPCHSFPVSQLPLQIQINVDGKKRKTEEGKAIDLRDCELLDLMQYRCKVEPPQQRNSPVVCYEVQRWFRRCQDKKGSFMVETTAWEGALAAPATATANVAATTDTRQKPKSTTDWHDGNRANFDEESI